MTKLISLRCMDSFELAAGGFSQGFSSCLRFTEQLLGTHAGLMERRDSQVTLRLSQWLMVVLQDRNAP